MTNAVFGELRKEDDYGWWGKQTLAFSGNTYTVDLLIHKGKEDEITKRQEEAFTCFMKEWPKLQEHLIEELIKYYNEYEYYSYGPEDEKELAEWWPEIKRTSRRYIFLLQKSLFLFENSKFKYKVFL